MKTKASVSATDLVRVLISLDSDEMQALASWSNLRGLKKFLQSRRPKGNWPTFARIKIGTHSDMRILLESLESRSHPRSLVGYGVTEVVGNAEFTLFPHETMIDLVAVTAADLGFKGLPPGYDKIIARGQEYGLKLCPPEVGLQLWIQGPPLVYGDWLSVAMDLLPGPQQMASHLVIECTNKYRPTETCLRGAPRQKFGIHYRFIFCR